MKVRVCPFRVVGYGGATYWAGHEFEIEEKDKLDFFLEAGLVTVIESEKEDKDVKPEEEVIEPEPEEKVKDEIIEPEDEIGDSE